MKAMILAAGLGTRLKPFTDKHPKALAIVNGKTILQRNIEYLASFGIKDVIVNVHHFADQIVDLIKHNDGFASSITVSDETKEVLETGGGLMRAKEFFDDNRPFVLLNVDILTNMNIDKMIDHHTSSKALATLCVSQRKTSRYFLFDENNNLCGWRNVNVNQETIVRPANNYFEKAFWGIHVISPQIFELVKQEGKFSIVDVYMDLCKTHTITAFDDADSKFIDVGKPESIALAEAMFA
jgi:MurNAc alpha-1-phosphate uridylyltransferase